MRLRVLALIPLLASCGLDRFLHGSGDAPAVAGAPARLAFVTQPRSAHAHKPLPAVQVAALDDQGNVVMRFTGDVAIALATNPSGGTLGDTTIVAAVNGVATFRHLQIDKAGTAYSLAASAPGTALEPVQSEPFDILPPETGSLTATTRTDGSGMPSSYTVTLDGTETATIGVTDSITASDVPAGSHTVELSGVPNNCSVGSPNPQTVTVPVGGNARASFTISCATPTGTLTVTTATTGSNFPTGYTVTLDGSQTATIGINDSLTATGVVAGDHSLLLGNVPANCAVSGANPQTVTVLAGGTTQASFAIGCGP